MKRRNTALVLLFFLSGTSGLVFEVVWLRYLSLVIGHTTFAVSVVVSAFLGGLAMGSYFIGKMAHRVARPLQTYALLEIATGVLALLLTLTLRHLEGISGAVGLPGGGPLALRVVLTFVLLLPPTFAMGGTLPMLTRFVARDLPDVGKSFAVLYGTNTLGAATGCALAGFYLIGAFGLWATACTAACVNLLVAVGAFALDRSSAPANARAPIVADEAVVAEIAEVRAPETGEETRLRRILIVAFALSGFASISYEVLWFRLLGLFLPSTAYAFTTLIVTFLTGLVAGSFIYSRYYAGRGRDLEVFKDCEFRLAVLGVISMALLGISPVIHSALEAQFGPSPIAMFVHASLVILVPATIIGIIFPCVVQLTTEHLSSAGHNVGVLYSLNTLGGIIGSLVVGFIGIPFVGTQRMFLVISFLNALIAVIVIRVDPSATPRARLELQVVSAVFAILSLLLFPHGWIVERYASAYAGTPRLLIEGRDGLLAVLEYGYEQSCRGHADCPDSCAAPPPWTYRQLRFGSMSYASTAIHGRRYMTALASLPMLTHEKPSNVLLVCFGTGTTAASFASFDELAAMRVVDVNPDVLAAAPMFREWNNDVLADSRVKATVDDGRHFLVASSDRFDVISFEPPPPRAAGTVSLYTREFYQLLSDHLNDGGMVTQWIPLEEQSVEQNQMLVESMLSVFKDVTLWIPSTEDAVLLGSNTTINIDPARWRKRWQEPKVEARLASAGYSNIEALLGTFVVDHDALVKYVAGAPPVTDDLPAVEYYFQRSAQPFNVDSLLSIRSDLTALLAGKNSGTDLQLMDHERQVNALFMRAAQENYVDHRTQARALMEQAAAMGGSPLYTDYFLRSLWGCMRPDSTLKR